MIKQLGNLPETMVGFSAEGDVTKEDFENIVLPACEKIIEQTGRLNYLIVLNTPLSHFTYEAWMQDVYLGLEHLFKWNRGAVVSDSESIRTFTDIFSIFIPGEFKGFEHSELQKAIDWTSEKIN